MNLLESIGQGLRGAGAVMSAPVYDSQNREREQFEQVKEQRNKMLADQTIRAIENGSLDPEKGKMVLEKLGMGDMAPGGPSAFAQQAARQKQQEKAAEAQQIQWEDQFKKQFPGLQKVGFDLPYGDGSDTDMQNRRGQFDQPPTDGGPEDEDHTDTNMMRRLRPGEEGDGGPEGGELLPENQGQFLKMRSPTAEPSIPVPPVEGNETPVNANEFLAAARYWADKDKNRSKSYLDLYKETRTQPGKYVVRDVGVGNGMVRTAIIDTEAGFKAGKDGKATGIVAYVGEPKKQSALVEIRQDQPLPEKAQDKFTQAFQMKAALEDIKSVKGKSGVITGWINKGRGALGVDKDAIKFQTAVDNLKVMAQAIIVGIPSNFDVQTFISTLPSITAAENVNDQRIAYTERSIKAIVSDTLAYYKGTKKSIPPHILEMARDIGVDPDNVKKWDGKGDPLSTARESLIKDLSSKYKSTKDAEAAFLRGEIKNRDDLAEILMRMK